MCSWYDDPKMPRVLFLSALFLMLLLLPLAPATAKTLASRAIETALETGTFQQVQQDLMMDLHQKQKFDFDEGGVHALGRKLLDQGKKETAIEVLQLNQVLHSESPEAAVAVADAYRESGQSMVAQVYYDKALSLDPGNQAARRGLQEIEGADEGLETGVGSDWELDPEAMQESLAQMGAQMSPEQMEEMQKAMEQLQEMQASGGQVAPPDPSRASRSTSQSKQAEAASEPEYESEFCMVLHRYNAEKKIPDAGVRARFEGEYGTAADAAQRKTWNVETVCGEFLVAVPLWADVSPPVMSQKDESRFEDAMGGTWVFEVGGNGEVDGVNYTSQDGTSSDMKRLGDPRKYD